MLKEIILIPFVVELISAPTGYLKSPTLCALSQMLELPVIGTLCHAQRKGYGDRCVAKEICGEGFFLTSEKRDR